jgi:hypothetical protein
MPKSKKQSTTKASQRCRARKLCRVCGKTGEETFRFLRRTFIFDVDRAREITQDGRERVELDRDDVLFAVDTSRIYIEHVPHVQTRFPGIIARVRCTTNEGKTLEGDLMIDGHHRAAKCLQDGKPFQVVRLTVEETDAILITRPDLGFKPPAAAKKRVAEKQRRGAARQRRPGKTSAAAR